MNFYSYLDMKLYRTVIDCDQASDEFKSLALLSPRVQTIGSVLHEVNARHVLLILLRHFA